MSRSPSRGRLRRSQSPEFFRRSSLSPPKCLDEDDQNEGLRREVEEERERLRRLEEETLRIEEGNIDWRHRGSLTSEIDLGRSQDSKDSKDMLEALQKESQYTERLKAEVEDEKRKIRGLQNRSALMNLKSAAARHMSDHIGGGDDGGFGNPVAGPSAASSIVESVQSDVLKPGNYIVAAWDALPIANETGPAAGGLICQLGAFFPHGVDFVQGMIVEEAGDLARTNTPAFKVLNEKWCQVLRGIPRPVGSTKEALEKFLTFLEKGRSSARPAYDGVLLLSHIQETIPVLIKSMRKHGLEERFGRTVKGMGDLCTYLAQCHVDKFMRKGKVDLSLINVLSIIKPSYVGSTCEIRAKNSYQVLENLMAPEHRPTYNNFFSTYIHPLNSKTISRMTTYRTLRERVELFLPLQQYVAVHLTMSDARLKIEGVYAPKGEEESKYLSHPPTMIAVAMCRMLVTSGSDFDQLLNEYKAEGPEKLELKVRTAFLQKMAGQSRAVIDQTIRTTKLVVQFFKTSGHRSLKELVKEAKLEQVRLDEMKEQRKMEAANQEWYKARFAQYKTAVEYFVMRLSHGQKTTPSGVKAKADMMVNTLLQAGLEHHDLLEIYQEDKKATEKTFLKEKLAIVLKNIYPLHAVPDMTLEDYVGLIADYLNSGVFSLKSYGAATPVTKDMEPKLVEPLIMDEYRQKLDRAIYKRNSTAGMKMKLFRSRATAFIPLRNYLVEHLMADHVANPSSGCGKRKKKKIRDYTTKVAESVQGLLSYLELDYAQMQMTYNSEGSGWVISLLRNLLAANRDLLPPGMTDYSLSVAVVEHLAIRSGAGGASTVDGNSLPPTAVSID
jgi:hypothetical protein